MPYGSYVNAKINVMTRIYNRKHNDLLIVLCLLGSPKYMQGYPITLERYGQTARMYFPRGYNTLFMLNSHGNEICPGDEL